MVLWIFIVIKENIVSDSNAQIGQKLQRCKRHIAMENFMTHLQKTLLKLMLFCHVKMFLLKRAPKCKSKNSHYVGLNDEIYETCKSCMKRNLLLYRNAVVLILRKLVFLKDLTELIASLSSLNFEKVQLAHEPNPDFTVRYVMYIGRQENYAEALAYLLDFKQLKSLCIINVHFGEWHAYNQLEFFVSSLNVKRLKITFWPFGLWDQLIAVMPLLSHYTILNNCTLENETIREGSKVLEIIR